MKKYRLLIVDDEESIRDMLSRYFRLLDFEVETAENGKVALEIMNKVKCDIVISDVNMPILDGVCLLREIKKQFPMTRCIMITGYVTMENVLSCMRHGAETCIFKPFDNLDEIELAVNKAINFLEDWEKKLKMILKMKPDTKDGK
jgi:YesN/AraC family two-component response regulator